MPAAPSVVTPTPVSLPVVFVRLQLPSVPVVGGQGGLGVVVAVPTKAVTPAWAAACAAMAPRARPTPAAPPAATFAVRFMMVGSLLESWWSRPPGGADGVGFPP